MSRREPTRDAARAAGLKRYFTGRPCVHGHVAERWVRSALCLECSREWKRAHYVPIVRKRMTDAQRVARERQLAREAYHRNPEGPKRSHKKWLAENALYVREYSKAYNKTHRDPIKSRARVKAWVKANPLKKKRHVQLHRARKASAVGSFSPSDVEMLLLEQGGRCPCGCDISKNYTIDHMTPLSRGGSNWPDNLQLLCRSCNSSKNTKTMAEWLDARGISPGMLAGIERATDLARPIEYRKLKEA